jgi:hypothetical protein
VKKEAASTCAFVSLDPNNLAQTTRFLPEIEPGAVPIVGDIVKVEQENGPEGVLDVCGVGFGDQLVGKGNDGGSTKSRPITLRSAPSIWQQVSGYLKPGRGEETNQ